MMAKARLSNVTGHLYSTSRVKDFASAAMTSFTINSTYRMLSGHDIPVLGYGVSMILDIHFQTPLLLNNFLSTKSENISLHSLR